MSTIRFSAFALFAKALLPAGFYRDGRMVGGFGGGEMGVGVFIRVNGRSGVCENSSSVGPFRKSAQGESYETQYTTFHTANILPADAVGICVDGPEECAIDEQ